MNLREWLPAPLQAKKRTMYDYATQFLPATASVTTTNEIQLKTDSYFLVLVGLATVTDTSDAVIAATAASNVPFNNPFLVTLSDSASGDTKSNIAVAFDNLFGNARYPFYWPVPWLLDPGAVIQVKVENLLSTDRRIRMVFRGVRIFSPKIQGV